MSASFAIQYAVVALAVLASLGVVMKKQFPNATRRLRVVMALPLLREGRPRWLRAIGRSIAPTASGEAGTCSGCDNCGPGQA